MLILEFSVNLGDDAQSTDSSSWSMECSQVLKVKEFYISSAILAAKSPFFFKVLALLLIKD